MVDTLTPFGAAALSVLGSMLVVARGYVGDAAVFEAETGREVGEAVFAVRVESRKLRILFTFFVIAVADFAEPPHPWGRSVYGVESHAFRTH